MDLHPSSRGELLPVTEVYTYDRIKTFVDVTIQIFLAVGLRELHYDPGRDGF